jgi:hypothetical protein
VAFKHDFITIQAKGIIKRRCLRVCKSSAAVKPHKDQNLSLCCRSYCSRKGVTQRSRVEIWKAGPKNMLHLGSTRDKPTSESLTCHLEVLRTGENEVHPFLWWPWTFLFSNTVHRCRCFCYKYLASLNTCKQLLERQLLLNEMWMASWRNKFQMMESLHSH